MTNNEQSNFAPGDIVTVKGAYDMMTGRTHPDGYTGGTYTVVRLYRDGDLGLCRGVVKGAGPELEDVAMYAGRVRHAGTADPHTAPSCHASKTV